MNKLINNSKIGGFGFFGFLPFPIFFVIIIGIFEMIFAHSEKFLLDPFAGSPFVPKFSATLRKNGTKIP